MFFISKCILDIGEGQVRLCWEIKMARQVWGTFSVKDHCASNAFVAEVMLYDRLVIPRPPDEKERTRWQKEGWQPERLDQLLEILGERAYVIDWDDARQQKWSNRFHGGAEIAQATGDWAFAATRTELTSGLPKYVTGIQALTNYVSKQELEEDLGLRSSMQGETLIRSRRETEAEVIPGILLGGPGAGT
jgi:hypothetical protein